MNYSNCLLAIILVVASTVLSQNVNIPDQNFKNRLIELGVDTNGDGEISYSEAESYTGELYLANKMISDLTGINAFTNTLLIDAHDNFLTSVDFHDLTSVETISVENNQLESLNLSNLESLNLFIATSNKISAASFNDLPGLTEINLIDNELDSLDLSGITSLVDIYVHHNLLSYLKVSGPKLLSAGFNELNDMIIEAPENVIQLYCNKNEFIILDVTGFTGLKFLNCANNLLEELYLPASLEQLNCNYNSLQEIQLNHISSLGFLNCKDNDLQTLDLETEAKNLHAINCENNSIDTLVIIDHENLFTLNCSENEISYLEIRNVNGINNNKIEMINCNNNVIDCLIIDNVIEIGTLDFSKNIADELDLSRIIHLDKLKISNCPNLKNVCVHKLPVSFELTDNGTDDYKMFYCNPYPAGIFNAGQLNNTFMNENELFWELEGSYDFDSDGIDDFTFTNLDNKINIKGINNTEIAAKETGGDLALLGMRLNDSIVPAEIIWSQDELRIKSWWMDPVTGNLEFYWHSDDFIALRKNSGESYSWFSFDFDNYYSTGNVWISGYASWKPCLMPPDIGNDTIVYLDQTITIAAGTGYDAYYWSTGEETQSIEFIASEWGTGEHVISLYVSKDSCNYMGQKMVTVLDQSNINEIVLEKISLFPVIASEKVTLSKDSPQKTALEVYNLQGNKLNSFQFSGHEMELDITGYSKGMYLIKYLIDRKIGTLKFIKR